jgi:hypothetical protein
MRKILEKLRSQRKNSSLELGESFIRVHVSTGTIRGQSEYALRKDNYTHMALITILTIL